MSDPVPDAGLVRSGACGCCGRPALLEVATGREIRGCLCSWMLVRYAKGSDTLMVPVRFAGARSKGAAPSGRGGCPETPAAAIPGASGR